MNMARNTKKSRDIAKLIRPSVRALTAYPVEETSVRVKLDAMENPFPLPEKVRREIAQQVRKTAVNLYPDPGAKRLRQAIGAFWGIRPEQMLLGNGSDELIQDIVIAFGGPVLTPAPSFAMYEITPRALSQDVVTVPLTKEFDLDADAVIRKARLTGSRIIFLAVPNNPTGNRYSDAAVRKVLESVNAAVVIDEAYFSFSGKTFLPYLRKHPNMIILRTLSKIGFAGLRIGVLTASPAVIAELNKVRLPYNINALSQAAAVAALRHRDVITKQINLLIDERKKLYRALLAMPGVTPFPSETNFLLLWVEKDATAVFRSLKKRGILVKNLDKPGPLKGCLRVTVGTPAQNREFLKELKSIVTTDKHR
jgi:histidinol-phosphate aminotransferase